MPSAPQKAFWAKGRSLEMQSTVVFFKPAASLLNPDYAVENSNGYSKTFE
jgi:hypothetical protein